MANRYRFESTLLVQDSTTSVGFHFDFYWNDSGRLTRIGWNEDSISPLLDLNDQPPYGVAALLRDLQGYFRDGAPLLPLHWDLLDASALTEFSRKVYEATLAIPHGETRTYAWVAKKAGKPLAARAVGQALSKNPFPVLIPCHRVVSDKTIGGFMGTDNPTDIELRFKLWLLDLERSYRSPCFPFLDPAPADAGASMRTRLSDHRLTRVVGALVSILFLVGVYKGLRSPGTDYRVFYSAAKLALEGRADILYREGPDRFLYAPGFAYLLTPLARLPYDFSHAIWLFLCVLGFSSAMKLFARRIDPDWNLGQLAVAIGTIFLLRSVWIDLLYGQVNLLILAASVWALLTFSADERDPLSSGSQRFLSWFFFSLAAFAKLYPLPLFLIPLLGFFQKETRARLAPIGVGSLAGVGLLALLPLLFSNQNTAFLYTEWFHGLVGRGFPLETHNQSFLAFLHRVFSGEIIRSHQTGGDPMLLFGRLLSDEALRAIFAVGSLVVAVLFVRSSRSVVREGSALAIGLSIALCFLPTHLIWKPYFLLGIPLAAAVFGSAVREESLARKRFYLSAFWILFLVTHLSTSEVVGRGAAAWYEAFSGFLWIHLGLVALGVGSLKLFHRFRVPQVD